jgi:hypothetical protein
MIDANAPPMLLQGIDITPKNGTLTALIKFTPSGTKKVEHLNIAAKLPEASTSSILSFKQVPATEGTFAIFNSKQNMAPNRKSASWQCNTISSGPAWFELIVAQPTSASITLNCGPDPFDVDIKAPEE